jgi:hypothetical protein
MRSNNSTIGVLPVPPTAKLPTHIMGKLNVADVKIFLLYNALRNKMIPPYNMEIGRNKYLKLFNTSIFFNVPVY